MDIRGDWLKWDYPTSVHLWYIYPSLTKYCSPWSAVCMYIGGGSLSLLSFSHHILIDCLLHNTVLGARHSSKQNTWNSLPSECIAWFPVRVAFHAFLVSVAGAGEEADCKVPLGSDWGTLSIGQSYLKKWVQNPSLYVNSYKNQTKRVGKKWHQQSFYQTHSQISTRLRLLKKFNYFTFLL